MSQDSQDVPRFRQALQGFFRGGLWPSRAKKVRRVCVLALFTVSINSHLQMILLKPSPVKPKEILFIIPDEWDNEYIL